MGEREQVEFMNALRQSDIGASAARDDKIEISKRAGRAMAKYGLRGLFALCAKIVYEGLSEIVTKLVMISVGVTLIAAYFVNIYKLATAGLVTGMVLLRFLGVLVPPLGAVLGFL